jgi:hypothetical protein
MKNTLIVPVIVTNAPIYTARYDASAVSLEGGEFTTAPDDVTAPPFVRFQKRFASGSVSDLGDRVFSLSTRGRLLSFCHS